jgi:hypothetical protein
MGTRERTEGNMGRGREGTGADWMGTRIRNVGNGERMEGRTRVYKVGGHLFTHLTPCGCPNDPPLSQSVG